LTTSFFRNDIDRNKILLISFLLLKNYFTCKNYNGCLSNSVDKKV